MFVPVILFGTFALLLALNYYFTRTFSHWKRKNIKGPKPTVFFGNIKDSTLRKEPLAIATKKVYDAFPNEPFVGMYRMTTPCLLIRDLDLIKNVMIKDFEMFDDRGVHYSTSGLGLNLVHADGETWRALRTRFTPLFTSGKLRNMFHLLTERGDKFLDYVEDITDKNPEQSVHKLVQVYTVITIVACAFGLDIDTSDKSDDILRRLDEIDRLIFTRNVFHEVDMMYPTMLKTLNMSLFPRTLTSFFENLVSKIVAERNGVASSRNDFMDLIMKLRGERDIPKDRSKESTLEITDEMMVAQAFIFYAGGYETSATTMAFMLYELAWHPHIQERLCKEIDEALEEANNVITYDILNRLPYMNQVFDETLRLYPPIDPLQRSVSKEDYTIPGTDVVIEKGTMVLVSAMGIHYDEKLYPNPKEFDPERFNPKMVGERHSCSYLPFGVGPRNCIGECAISKHI